MNVSKPFHLQIAEADRKKKTSAAIAAPHRRQQKEGDDDDDAPKKKRGPRRELGPIEPGQPLLLKEQMLKVVGHQSYSAIWGLMKRGEFPLPIALGPPEGRTTKVAWMTSEVHAWIASRPRRPIGKLGKIRDAQDDAAERKRTGAAR